MKRIAQFHKVSMGQFTAAMREAFPEYPENALGEAYEGIRLPRRATKGSAGYDFFAPVAFSLKPGQSVMVPTGIRARMEDGWVLTLYPRSGLGCRYRLQLDNTVGLIDSDYFYSDNEGHIMARLTNDSREGKPLDIQAGMGFMQGVFLEYGITQDDEAGAVRNGGFGSTSGQ